MKAGAAATRDAALQEQHRLAAEVQRLRDAAAEAAVRYQALGLVTNPKVGPVVGGGRGPAVVCFFPSFCSRSSRISP